MKNGMTLKESYHLLTIHSLFICLLKSILTDFLLALN
ncbi:hypothetical protein JOD17_000385 [Geomicrobium sediminis]|uniref:Uncharacterized protein n=1 Tax=Geomicrobium sediminis TaxID=1347788 RepID=A0ABS2P7A8_9BACL|nr:hypothetical protein [Geomicrobium sediminis]